jgi:WD40 repeat protein
VVYRRSFPDERPYEREFRGIQKFEPISRTHDSQVDILHVGRDDTQGYFYYVMELADASSAELEEQVEPETGPRSKVQGPKSEGQLDVDRYAPKTLKSELARRGSLAVEDCVEIGLALATALEHLHENGLVHRDVKPSNIIFVSGTPKLADIGLVTDIDATMSFVGTEGYVPPEGPGTVQADIYSLGMVLYEIATGKGRQQFPEPPTLWEGRDDEQSLREFHEILLRACERDSAQRYQSAREMRADLALLQSGKSIRRLRALERRVKVLTRMGIIGVTLLVVVSGAFMLALFQQRAQSQRHRAEAAEQVAKERLWNSYLFQARELRTSGRGGRRFESLELLKKAANIRPSLELRNEAIACLALRDFRPGPESKPFVLDLGTIFDRAFERCASCDTNGDITVRALKLPSPTAFIPSPRGTGSRLWFLKFSPDGRFLLTEYHPTNLDLPNLFRVWRLQPQEKLLELTNGIYHSAADFSRDSRLLALSEYQGNITIYHLTTMQLRNEFEQSGEPESLRFSPDASKLAVCGHERSYIKVRDARTGKTLSTVWPPNIVWGIDWHPGGRLLAAACFDGNVHVWDIVTTQHVAVLEGHTDKVTAVAFSHSGDLIASASYDSSIRLWDALQAKELAQLPITAYGLHFSEDDLLLGDAATQGGQFGRLEVASGLERRVLHGHQGICVNSGSFSPDGQLLATAGNDGVRFWDVRTCAELGFLSSGETRAVFFLPDGSALLSVGSGGVRRWNIEVLRGETGLHVNASEVTVVPCPSKKCDSGALSFDGRYLAVSDWTAGAWLLDLAQPGKIPVLLPHQGAHSIALSADNRLVATATFGGTGVKIWAAATSDLITELPVTGRAQVAFSPSGSSLAVGSVHDFALWETNSWKADRPIVEENSKPAAGASVFGPDGRMLAISTAYGNVNLVDPKGGNVLARLEGQNQLPLVFSPDSAILVVSQTQPAQKAPLVILWDLRLIRRELAAMNLDWDAPPFPPVPSDSGSKRAIPPITMPEKSRN